MLVRDVGMTARDGVHLATDVWRPAQGTEPASGQFPALLLRTPYERTHGRYEVQGEYWASRGYVFAVQDCRGRFGSGGDFVLLANEGPDGFDAVEWLAELPFCDGNVGTYGTSYSAWVQNALAIERPPHLRAMWIHQGGANGVHSSLRHNGALELRWLTWAVTHGAATLADTDPHLAETWRARSENMFDWLCGLPWGDQSPVAELEVYADWTRELYEHGDAVSDDGYWLQKGLNFEAYYDQTLDVPTMYSGGWYDSYTRATTDIFTALNKRLGHQRLLMGPWIHGDAALESSSAGSVDLGASASMATSPDAFPGGSRLGELERWFAPWLTGEVMPSSDAPVRLFVMGGGEGTKDDLGRLRHGGSWRSESEWPLRRAVETSFYLLDEGALGREPSISEASSSTFTYDPKYPVPTVSANTSSLNEVVPSPARIGLPSPIALMRNMVLQGGSDQIIADTTLRIGTETGPLHEHNGVLSFETAPLAEAIEITGPVRADLVLTSTAIDTDLFVMVQDVYPASGDWPHGYNLNVTDGIMRVRYREGLDTGKLMVPGETVAVSFQLYPTSNVFAVGHRIRVLVTSSSFPRFDPNPNTGEAIGRHTHTVIAHNTIHHDIAHRSRIVVDTIPAS